MVITDYFTTAVCINLDSRIDKANECAEEFDKHCLNVYRLSAIDGNKLNNCVENLEWVDWDENVKHAYETGLNKPNFFPKF